MGNVVYLQAKAIGQSQIHDENTITYLHKMGNVVYLQAEPIVQSETHEENTIILCT